MLPKLLSREELVIATKVRTRTMPGENGVGLSRKHIMASIDGSLQRLGLDYVDLYQIHRWDPSTPIEETMEALHDVVKAGKARYIGASSMFAWQFAKAQAAADRIGGTRFVSMQNHYNLVYREEEREMIPQCIDQGVAVLPWSPLARGLLAGNRTRRGREADDACRHRSVRRLALRTPRSTSRSSTGSSEIAGERGVPGAQVALAWLLRTARRDGADRRRHEGRPCRRRRRRRSARAHGRRGRAARGAVRAARRVGARVAAGVESASPPGRGDVMAKAKDPIVIIGGGRAAASFVDAYREAGGEALITIVSADESPPYNRPPLSKGVLRGEMEPDGALVHEAEEYDDLVVELRLDTRVESVDPGAHTVQLAGGESIPYGTLVIASGAHPRRLSVPGGDLPAVQTFRTLADAVALAAGGARGAQDPRRRRQLHRLRGRRVAAHARARGHARRAGRPPRCRRSPRRSSRTRSRISIASTASSCCSASRSRSSARTADR